MRAGQLRPLAHTRGPFASVYLDVTHDTEDATHRDELRWQAVASELAEHGVAEPTVQALREAVLDRPVPDHPGRAVIAADGAVLADQPLPRPPRGDIVRVSELPYLVPLFTLSDPPVPRVIVVADKINGQLSAVDRDGDDVPADSVHGRDHPVHQVGGGGPAHGRIEHRAEETVRRNATDIAEHATRLVERVGAEIVVLAGEVQARSAVRAALPTHCERLVTEVDLDAESIDRDPDRLSTAITRILAEQQAGHDGTILERIAAGAAHGLARQGMAEVVPALRAGQVETLVLTDPALGDRTVWLSDDRSQLATRREDGTTKQRADEALPVVAIATAADIAVLTDEATVTDGVAALLRYA